MDVRLEPAPVRGFRFAGVAAGLRTEPERKDLGAIVAEGPVAAAGVFTTSKVKAGGQPGRNHDKPDKGDKADRAEAPERIDKIEKSA